MAQVIDARGQFARRAKTVRLRELWSLVGDLGLRIPGGKEAAEEIMRSICRERHGVESTKILDAEQIRDVARMLRSRLYGTPEPPKPATLDTPITRKQQRAIKWLYEQAGLDTPARRRGFAKRIIKRAQPHTREEGSKLYQALEALCLQHVDWGTIEAHVLVLQAMREDLNAWQQQKVKELAHKLDQAQRVTYWLVTTVEHIYAEVERRVLNVSRSSSREG